MKVINVNVTSTNYNVFSNCKSNVKTSSESNNDLIFSIAKWFLSRESMSNKKLQKMCYYAYCWCIVLLSDLESTINDTICKEGFEAWIHGPVCRSLYYSYKNYGWDNIPAFNEELHLPEMVIEVLEEVWSVYGKFTASQLERLTHSEEPWIEARKDLNPEEVSSKRISVKTIYNYYSKQLINE